MHLKQETIIILKPEQNGCHSADNIFKDIFLYENVCALIQISSHVVPTGSPNDNDGSSNILTSFYVNQCWPVHCRMYPLLSIKELNLLLTSTCYDQIMPCYIRHWLLTPLTIIHGTYSCCGSVAAVLRNISCSRRLPSGPAAHLRIGS